MNALPIDLFKLPRIMRSRWRLLAVCAATLALITAAGHVLLPVSYTATTSVVIDSRGVNHVLGVNGGSVAHTTLVATQASIVGSERVARQVVTDLALAEDPALRAQWQEDTHGAGDIAAWAAQRILRAVSISRAAPDSTVLTITVSDPQPARAAQLANAFAQAYLAVTLDVSVAPSRTTARFFDEQVNAKREALQDLQQKLSRYQRENGIVSGDEKLDIETAQLNELASALTSSRTRRIDSRSRNRQAVDQAQSAPEVLQNPVVQALTTEVARSEAKLKELANSLGANHPRFREAKVELSELQSKLAEQTTRVAGSLRAGEQASTQGESEILSALNAQRARVMQLKNHRDRLTVLEREVDSAQKAYDQALQRFSQTTQESQSGLNDAAILTRASVPFRPAGRSPILTVPFAAIAGLLVGIIIAMMLEHRSPRIRSVDDVEQALGLPVLGSVAFVSPIRAAPVSSRRLLPFLNETRRSTR